MVIKFILLTQLLSFSGIQTFEVNVQDMESCVQEMRFQIREMHWMGWSSDPRIPNVLTNPLGDIKMQIKCIVRTDTSNLGPIINS